MKRFIDQWLEYVNNNYKDVGSFYIRHWVRFSDSMKSRSKLITITDGDIYIVEKIFNNIKMYR